MVAKIITCFNHKGGIGKTTLIYNLAYELKQQGQRVLLIDADSQMNLTALVYRLSTEVEYSYQDHKIHDDLEDITRSWQNMRDNYISLSEYLTSRLSTEEEHQCNKIFYRYNNPNQPDLLDDSSANIGFIDLISGDEKIFQTELNIIARIKAPNGFDGNILYKFEQAIRDQSNKYDFILIDTSPSFSLVNGLFVFSSDYFFTPVKPDFFSLQAIDNLAGIYRSWRKIFDDYQMHFTGTNRLCNFQVKYLGVVVQMAKLYEQNDGEKFANVTQQWIVDLNRRVQRFCNLLMGLHIGDDNPYIVSIDKFKKNFPESNPFIIAIFCDYNQRLAKVAEYCKVPVNAITEKHCVQYNANPNHKTKAYFTQGSIKKPIEDTKLSYKNLASCLIKNLQ
jgi:chromosome partitioning protein